MRGPLLLCWIGFLASGWIPGTLTVAATAEEALHTHRVPGLPQGTAYYTTTGGDGAVLAWCRDEVKRYAGEADRSTWKYIQPATTVL